MPKQIPRAWVNYMEKYFSKVSWETNDLELDHRSILEAFDYLEGGSVKNLHFNTEKNQYEGTVYRAYPSYLYDGYYGIVYEEETVTYSIEYGQLILYDYRQFIGDLPF